MSDFIILERVFPLITLVSAEEVGGRAKKLSLAKVIDRRCNGKRFRRESKVERVYFVEGKKAMLDHVVASRFNLHTKTSVHYNPFVYLLILTGGTRLSSISCLFIETELDFTSLTHWTRLRVVRGVCPQP